MISANVIEELCGSGWTRDDVQTRHIEGKTTHEELWRKNQSVELRHLGKTMKLFSGKKLLFLQQKNRIYFYLSIVSCYQRDECV